MTSPVVQARLPQDLYDKLTARSEATGVKASLIVRQALEAFLGDGCPVVQSEPVRAKKQPKHTEPAARPRICLKRAPRKVAVEIPESGAVLYKATSMDWDRIVLQVDVPGRGMVNAQYGDAESRLLMHHGDLSIELDEGQMCPVISASYKGAAIDLALIEARLT